MQTFRLPAGHPAVTAAAAAVDAYYVAAAASPAAHGQGAPHPLVALAFFRALASMPLPVGVDAGVAARHAVLNLWVLQAGRQPMDALCCYLTHFSVAALPPNEAGIITALVSFSIEGDVSLPDAGQLAAVTLAVETSHAAGDPAPMQPHVDRCFSYTDGVPTHTGGRPHQLDRIFCTLISTLGGTRSVSRAPQGGAAKRLGGRGRGRGRGT